MFISEAFAQAAPAATAAADSPFGSLGSMLPLVLMFVVLYFVMIRPQMKRQKEAKAMIDALAKGDEVVTTGGMLGKISKIGESFLTVEIANGVEIQVQRGAVVQVLPKGLSAEDRSEMDVAMFGVALRALHRQRRVPCTFETVEGDAARTLVERSHGAAVLVVGRDAPDAVESVGRYCQEHAACDVLTVTGPDLSLQPAGRADVSAPNRA